MASVYKEKGKAILEKQGKDVKEVENSFIVKGITLLTTGSSRDKEPIMDIFWKEIVDEYEKEHYSNLAAHKKSSDGNEKQETTGDLETNKFNS